MPNLKIKEFIIPEGHINFASDYVCREGVDLRFLEEPIPKGNISGIPMVLIKLEGSSYALYLFGCDIAKNS